MQNEVYTPSRRPLVVDGLLCEEFKQLARHHFSWEWARWEIPGLLTVEARRRGVGLTPEQAEQIVREALPEIRL